MPLFKVTPPRNSLLFEPSTFFRSDDFRTSTTNPREGLVQDKLLYVGDFDGIAIHLFPPVLRLLVSNNAQIRNKLELLGFQTDSKRRFVVFMDKRHHMEVMNFKPTVFEFDEAHFLRTPSGEYVSRMAVHAIGYRTYPMLEVIDTWSIQVIFVPEVLSVRNLFESNQIPFISQD